MHTVIVQEPDLEVVGTSTALWRADVARSDAEGAQQP